MAGTYVAETLQWRENCLGYMNSWLGERCVFEKPGVEAGRDRSIVSVHPLQCRRTVDALYSAPSRGHLVHSETKSLGPSLRRLSPSTEIASAPAFFDQCAIDVGAIG